MHDPATATRRLFIGLMPDAAVRAAIALHRQRWHWPPGVRPTPAAMLHLTLHFLGEVDAVREAVLRAALAEVSMDELPLTLATAVAWPNGIAALQPAEHAGLRALQHRLAAPVRVAGLTLTPHDHWTPHVTLARDAAHAAPPEAFRGIAWTARHFALVWSRRGPPAARYELLACHPAPQG